MIAYGASWLASLAGVLGIEGLRLHAETGVPVWVARLGWVLTAWLSAPLLLVVWPMLIWRARTPAPQP
jgi:hypothetical protein